MKFIYFRLRWFHVHRKNCKNWRVFEFLLKLFLFRFRIFQICSCSFFGQTGFQRFMVFKVVFFIIAICVVIKYNYFFCVNISSSLLVLVIVTSVLSIFTIFLGILITNIMLLVLSIIVPNLVFFSSAELHGWGGVFFWQDKSLWHALLNYRIYANAI